MLQVRNNSLFHSRDKNYHIDHIDIDCIMLDQSKYVIGKKKVKAPACMEREGTI